jgi:pilus assembly protein Flp/PilA
MGGTMMTVAAGGNPRPSSSSGRTERGATAVEYGLLIAGIAAVIALTVYLFGGEVLGLFVDSCVKVTSQTGGNC